MKNTKTPFLDKSISLLAIFVVLLSSSAGALRTSKAAINDYTVTGANPASLPDVGAAGVILPTITLTSSSDDDFVGADETIRIYKASIGYSGLSFDPSVLEGDLTIGGSCGFDSVVGTSYFITGGSLVTMTIHRSGGAAAPCTDGQTITIDGLKMISTASQAAPGSPIALVAVDNSTTSPGFPVQTSDRTQLPISAADLNASATKATPVTGSTDDLTLDLTLPSNLSADGTIEITFPSSYTIANTTATITSGSINPNAGNAELSVTANNLTKVLTLTVSGGLVYLNSGVVSITIPGVDAIPDYVDTTNITSIVVKNSTGATIASDSSVALTDTTAASLTSTNIEPASLITGETGNVTISFTTVNAIPSNGKIVIDLPATFDATSSNAVSGATNIDGTFTVVPSNGDGTNDIITITRQNDGTPVSGGTAVSFVINDVQNPASSGSTGVYSIETQTSAGATIDSDTNVTADTMSDPAPAPAPAPAPGGVVILPVTNPVIPQTNPEDVTQVTPENVTNPETQQTESSNETSVKKTENIAPIIKPSKPKIATPKLRPAAVVPVKKAPRTRVQVTVDPRTQTKNPLVTLCTFPTEERLKNPLKNGLKADIDSDSDGISNVLEQACGTNLANKDTDSDGYTDGEELYDLGSDPLNINDPVNQNDRRNSTIPIRVTGFFDKQIVQAVSLIKGIANINSTVEITIKESTGSVVHQGQTRATENGVFLYEVPIALENGTYTIEVAEKAESSLVNMLKADIFNASESTLKQNKPAQIQITVNNKADITPPTPNKLDQKDLTEENLLKGARVVIINNKPMLIGKTKFGTEVLANWHSVVLTSALIADTTTGEFAIEPPKNLNAGDHDVFLQTVRPKDGAMSKTVKISFKIDENTAAALNSSTSNSTSNNSNQTQVSTNNNTVTYSLIGFAILILAAGVIIYVRKKKSIASSLTQNSSHEENQTSSDQSTENQTTPENQNEPKL